MCFIIISIKKNKRTKENVNNFIKNTYIAFANNPDMEGLYLSATNEIYKSIEKQNFEKIKQEIQSSSVLLYHARYSTSGFGFENCQPCKLGNYVFLHNGIFNIKHYFDKSDSVVFFEEMYKNILLLNSVKNAFARTYNELIINKHCNSYSFAVYDVEKKLLHYIKNNATNILMYKNSDEIILATNRIVTNLNYTTLNPYVFYTIDKNLNIFQEQWLA